MVSLNARRTEREREAGIQIDRQTRRKKVGQKADTTVLVAQRSLCGRKAPLKAAARIWHEVSGDLLSTHKAGHSGN